MYDGQVFTYDAAGTPLAYSCSGSLAGFIYDGEDYYYRKDLEGDITGIYDDAGNLKVTYTYDMWGKQTGVTDTSGTGLADVNPFRYRGYYYDSETGYYYLNSRYYDPETGRFLNADDPAYIGDSGIEGNLYAYCGNNAVNMEDPDGYFALSAKTAAFIADSLISVIVILLVHKLKAVKNKTSINIGKFLIECGLAIAKSFVSNVLGYSWAKKAANALISLWNAANNQKSFFKKAVDFVFNYLSLTIADRLDSKLPNVSLYVSKKGWLRAAMNGGKYAVKLNFASVFTSIQETFSAILRRL